MKKSAMVREMIATAKAQGLTAQDIITAVMSDLGFQRQLARAYVNNNWDKVEAAAPAAEKPAKALSMSKDAVRKREARARAKAAKELAAAQAAGCEADPMEDVNYVGHPCHY